MKSLLIKLCIILITVFSLSCNEFRENSTSCRENHLIGTWKYISLNGESDRGEVIYPYGENMFGRLMYDSKGNMSAFLMHPNRPKFVSGDTMKGTSEELKSAFEKFDAYCGTYTINKENSSVTHHVQGAKFPNWIGTDQIRYYKFSNDTLRISAPPIMAHGVEWNFKAVLVRL